MKQQPETYTIPNTKDNVVIRQAPDGSFRTEYDNKNIVALDTDTMKSALLQVAMYTVTSKWTPMIMVRREGEDLSLDTKFIGIITETGCNDKYVISDIIAESNDMSTWKPHTNYREWINDGTYSLITYSKERYDGLLSLCEFLSSLKTKVLDVLCSGEGTSFIDQYIVDPDVVFDAMK